jgi:hypothetical protein
VCAAVMRLSALRHTTRCPACATRDKLQQARAPARTPGLAGWPGHTSHTATSSRRRPCRAPVSRRPAAARLCVCVLGVCVCFVCVCVCGARRLTNVAAVPRHAPQACVGEHTPVQNPSCDRKQRPLPHHHTCVRGLSDAQQGVQLRITGGGRPRRLHTPRACVASCVWHLRACLRVCVKFCGLCVSLACVGACKSRPCTVGCNAHTGQQHQPQNTRATRRHAPPGAHQGSAPPPMALPRPITRPPTSASSARPASASSDTRPRLLRHAARHAAAAAAAHRGSSGRRRASVPASAGVAAPAWLPPA